MSGGTLRKVREYQQAHLPTNLNDDDILGYVLITWMNHVKETVHPATFSAAYMTLEEAASTPHVTDAFS